MSGYCCCEHCAKAIEHEPFADGHDIPCGAYLCKGGDWVATPREQAASAMEGDAGTPQSSNGVEARHNPTVLYLTAEIAKREDSLRICDDEITSLHATIERLKCEAWALKSALSRSNGLSKRLTEEVNEAGVQIQAALGEVVRLEAEGERRTDVLASLDRMTLDPSLVTCIQAAFDRRAQ